MQIACETRSVQTGRQTIRRFGQSRELPLGLHLAQPVAQGHEDGIELSSFPAGGTVEDRQNGFDRPYNRGLLTRINQAGQIRRGGAEGSPRCQRGEVKNGPASAPKKAAVRRTPRKPFREAPARSWGAALLPLEPDYWAGPESPDVSRQTLLIAKLLIGCDEDVELPLGQSQ